MGFFNVSELQQAEEPEPTVPKCGQCGLFKTCNSPKLAPVGAGKRGILIVSEAPGKEEDMNGRQLVGNSSRELLEALSACDVSRSDFVLTNSVICRPPKGRQPTSLEIDNCRASLLNTISKHNPTVIILMGGSAVDSLIPYLWGDSSGGINRWVGWRIPDQKLNAWICPTYHPAFVIRKEQDDGVARLLFRQHIAAAVELAGTRPWEEVPDYKSQVQVLYDPDTINKRLRWFAERSGPIAFDYETNRLKPEHPKAKVWSFSVSDGTRTIAFPWYPEIVDSVSELLRCDRPKIASNMKFEDRWTRAVLGHEITNWAWDTMLNAHLIDNRESICSIKFQAYIHRGQRLWNSRVDSFLTSSKNEDKLNQIHLIDLDDLLLYNGLDSLLEILVAKDQRRLLP